jgi:hypothetical protein
MDLEQLEALAFATDRETALAHLLPGSADHDYFHCVHLQQRGDLAAAQLLIDDWGNRHSDGRDQVLRLRQQLLLLSHRFDQQARDDVRDAFAVHHWHEPEAAEGAVRLPSALDHHAIDGAALLREAVRSSSDLSQVSEEGIYQLLDGDYELDEARRGRLLERLGHTPSPRLVELVAGDMGPRELARFGTVAAHRALTLPQLVELAQLRPELRQHKEWVTMVVQRMRPPAHVDIDSHGAARHRYLLELWAFVSALAEPFVSLQLHVAWHLLDEGRRGRRAGDPRLGQRDRGLLLAYLRLPRHASYLDDRWRHLPPAQMGRHGVDFRVATGLATVVDDEALVRDYLFVFLAEGDEGDDLAPLFERSWFEHERATIRLLAGAPEPERWTRILGPEAAQALLEKVEIDLGIDNPEVVAEHDLLRLEVDLKNVSQLFIKVFRIDPVTYFAIHGKDVSADIDLDGLAASHEEVLTFIEPPLSPILRVRRSLEFAYCQRAGCYVIDLIGNGKSSRALLWRGRLRFVRRISASGQLLTIFDQSGRLRPSARVWMGGREFVPGDDGVVALPFSSSSTSLPILLVDGELASVSALSQVAEQYALRVQAHVEREALSSNRTVRALVQVELLVSGVRVPLALLQQPSWELVLTDRQGAVTQRTMPLTLDDTSCAVLEWPLGEDIAKVAIQVRGRVEMISEQRSIDVAATLATDLATMNGGPYVDSLYLASTDKGYVLSALGKSGEPKPRQRIPLWFVHRWARTQCVVSLDTDDQGRIDLGRLAGVESLQATAVGIQHGWHLVARGAAATVHALAGETIYVPPPMGISAEDLLRHASLVELRSGQPAMHAIQALQLAGRNLAVLGLAAGEYQLRLPMMDPWWIIVLPSDVHRVADYAATATELFRLTPAPALIHSVEVRADELTIAVLGASATTRVHVVATRFMPAPAMGSIESPRRGGGRGRDGKTLTHYQSGRDLGDEYRYVLERRNAARRPGTLLDKPSLLLHPWARKSTTTQLAEAGVGGAYGGGQAPRAAMMSAPSSRGGPLASGGGFATFDFVPGDAVLLANLRADRDGRIRVARNELGEASAVQVFCVDAEQTTSMLVAVAERALLSRDQRLLRALPADAHITQRRQIDPCRVGQTVVIQDAATAKVHIVDTVERAHAYLLALSGDPTLREFEFITRWHRLDEEERGALYNKYACHELHLFLFFRDRPYFDQVVAKALAQKRVQTFIDRWLLGADLSRYLEPRELGRLCAAERALLALRSPQGDAVARLLADEVAMLPPDPAGEARIVEVMLAGAALDDDASGLREHTRKAKEAGSDMELGRGEFEDATSSMAPAAPAGAMAMTMAPPSPAMPRAKKSVMRQEESFAATDMEKERGGDVRRRTQVAPLFRPADKTQEWAEHNWWHRRPQESTAQMIAAHRFWRDLAAHRDGPFLSSALGLAVNSFAEAMCALAVLDVPFEATPHRIDNDGATLTIHAGCHALIASSQLVPAELTADLPIIVGQSYLRNDDRHHLVDGEYVQKFVTDPLIAGVIYVCQVVVANPTGTQQRVSVLIQIPRGSVATNAANPTRTYDVVLPPYAAHGLEVSFYFPAAGSFSHFGAHVSKRGTLIAAAAGATLQVIAAGDAIDTGSWSHISQHGSLHQTLELLRSSNLHTLDLSRIAWRMRDPEAYREVMALLEQRLAFDSTLWSYALWHGDRDRTRRWLRCLDRLTEAGPVIEAALVGLDAEELDVYEHLEYAPLINARAHRLGAKTRILNDGFARQLTSFLELVAHRTVPTVDDHLIAAHYLFAQDRFDDARVAIARADRAGASDHRSRMQLDYLRAYSACAEGDLGRARELLRPWINEPVDRWRKRFAALAAMLDQIDGAAPTVVDPRSREQVQSNLAQAQPSFELVLDASGIELVSQQLPSIELRYFAMDIELLFSRQPFVQADVARFSYIEPGYREVVELHSSPQRVLWPESMRGKNVVVEAVGAGLRKAKVHYAHDLAIVVAHQYGQVRVQRASTQIPAVAAYIKVYARRHDGVIAFYKDGYTDLRGWFDYASLSTDELDRAARFSILVHGDSLGATIVETEPPLR